jgi:PST family polysaccharide transporter
MFVSNLKHGAGTSSLLDKSMARGIAWTGISKWFGQLISWFSTLIIVRILSPRDYGLVGMCSVLIALVTIFKEFGLNAAIVNRQDLTTNEVNQLHAFSVLLGVAAFAITCLAGYPLSVFYGVPELSWILRVMGLSYLITGFQTVPYALLQKQFRFKSLALMEGMQSLLMAPVMVCLALMGAGYWTLILGGLVGNLFMAGMMLSSRAVGFAWPNVKSIRSALIFSWHILVSRFGWFLQANGDFIVAGRVLGAVPLGIYTIGWTVSCLPVEKITTIVARVTPAFFAAVRYDKASLRRYLLLVSEGLSLLTFGMAIGLALVAQDFVMTVLGQKWLGATAPLRLLALSVCLRAVDPLIPLVLTAIGHTRFGMYCSLLAAVVLPSSFWFGSRWGTEGIAAVWLLVYPLLILPVFYRVFRAIGLSAQQYLRCLWPAVNATLVMALVVLGVKIQVGNTITPAVRLGLQALTGAFAYVLTVFVFHRDRTRVLYSFLREVS